MNQLQSILDFHGKVIGTSISPKYKVDYIGKKEGKHTLQVAYTSETTTVSPPNLQGWKIDKVEISQRLLVQVGYSQV
jgi:hypothetical protein